jgi:hypothetical protein
LLSFLLSIFYKTVLVSFSVDNSDWKAGAIKKLGTNVFDQLLTFANEAARKRDKSSWTDMDWQKAVDISGHFM